MYIYYKFGDKDYHIKIELDIKYIKDTNAKMKVM